jgi:hypothetical protein
MHCLEIRGLDIAITNDLLISICDVAKIEVESLIDFSK